MTISFLWRWHAKCFFIDIISIFFLFVKKRFFGGRTAAVRREKIIKKKNKGVDFRSSR